MQEHTQRNDTGIIIARFQCNILHEGHIDLIDSVLARHSRVIVFLGISPLRNTKNNPLDYKHREYMIKEKYPNIEVHYVDDNRSDEIWSKNLDRQIRKWLNPNQTATLYGSRDSFIKHYSGNYPTCELISEKQFSSTAIRNNIINNYVPTEDFRAGLIAATGLRYPTVFTTVDIAIFDESETKLLLGRKPNESKFRFIGGFSDIKSTSFEQDARREVQEETNIDITDPIYVGSFRIDDHRYRKEIDKITTIFFRAKYFTGKPTAGDDIEEIRWFLFQDLQPQDIVDEHHILLAALKKK